MALNKSGIQMKRHTINRKPVDFYLLHRSVREAGGLEALMENPDQWEEVVAKLGFPQTEESMKSLRSLYDTYLVPLDEFELKKRTAPPAPAKTLAEPIEEKVQPALRTSQPEEPSKEEKVQTVENSPPEEPIQPSKNEDGANSETSAPLLKRSIGSAPSSPKKLKLDDEVQNIPSEQKKEESRLEGEDDVPPLSKKQKVEEAEVPRKPVTPSRYAARDRKKPVKYQVPAPRLSRQDAEELRIDKLVCELCKDGANEDQLLLCDGCDRGFHSFCLGFPSIPEHGFYCTECEQQDFLDFGYVDGAEYTLKGFKQRADRMRNTHFRNKDKRAIPNEEIEAEFWRIVDSAQPLNVEYGSDCPGSAFPKEGPYADDPWNLSRLPRLDNSAFSKWSGAISGVTMPWLYVGMCFTSFCWHNEDHYCYSINYLWKGAPKKWYGVPGTAAAAFEQCMKETVPDLFKHDPMILFHLVTMLSPARLRQYQVPLCKATQNQNEFIITFPQAYHAGFNCGFNLAEAVNFAPMDWFPVGRNCVERYRQYRREYVFSHDRLLYVTLMRDQSYNTAKELKAEFEATMAHQKEIRSQAIEAGLPVIQWEDDPTQEMREMPCVDCKLLLFFHAVSCECTPNTFACFEHRAALCSCGRQRLELSWTDEYVNRQNEEIQTRLSLPDKWIEKVNQKLSGRLSIPEIRNLLAEQKTLNIGVCPEEGQLRKLVVMGRAVSKDLAVLRSHFLVAKRRKKKPQEEQPQDPEERYPLTLPMLEEALAKAAECPLELAEAENLSKYVAKVKAWIKRAQNLILAPVRDQRHVNQLISAASGFPIELKEVELLSSLQEFLPVEKLYADAFKSGQVSQKKFEEVLARCSVLPSAHPLVPILDALDEQGIHFRRNNFLGEVLIDRAETVLSRATPAELSEVDSLLSAFKVKLSIAKRVSARCLVSDQLVALAESLHKPFPFEQLQTLYSRANANCLQIVYPELEEALARGQDWLAKAVAVFSLPSSKLALLDCLSSQPPPLVDAPQDRYCWCRQRSFGQMACCDVCDMWYHLSCVPYFSPDAPLYVCPRCKLTKRPPASAIEELLKAVPADLHFTVVDRMKDLLLRAVSAASEIQTLLNKSKRTKEELSALWKKVVVNEVEVPGLPQLEADYIAKAGLTASEHDLRPLVIPKEGEYCFCKRGNSAGDIMISCDFCERWYHGKCVGLAKGQLEEGICWACPPCCYNYGPRSEDQGKESTKGANNEETAEETRAKKNKKKEQVERENIPLEDSRDKLPQPKEKPVKEQKAPGKLLSPTDEVLESSEETPQPDEEKLAKEEQAAEAPDEAPEDEQAEELANVAAAQEVPEEGAKETQDVLPQLDNEQAQQPAA